MAARPGNLRPVIRSAGCAEARDSRGVRVILAVDSVYVLIEPEFSVVNDIEHLVGRLHPSFERRVRENANAAANELVKTR